MSDLDDLLAPPIHPKFTAWLSDQPAGTVDQVIAQWAETATHGDIGPGPLGLGARKTRLLAWCAATLDYDHTTDALPTPPQSELGKPKMSAIHVTIEGLADSWTAEIEVGGRVTAVKADSLDAVVAASMTAYADLTAPAPADPVPVEEPASPTVGPTEAEIAQQKAADDLAASVAAEDDRKAAEAEQAAADEKARADAEAATKAAEDAAAAEKTKAEADAAARAALEQRAQTRSGLNDSAWAGLPDDDRKVLVSEQAAFELASAGTS